MFQIYLATNLINGKVYVGQTSRGIRRRWQTHCSLARRGSPNYFWSAIRKNGPEGFDVREIAKVDTKAEADNLERLWIIVLRSFDRKYGYNGTFGGDGLVATPEIRLKMKSINRGPNGHLYRHDILDSDLVDLYVNQWLSLRTIAAKLGCASTTVRMRLQLLGVSRVRTKRDYRLRRELHGITR